MLDVLNVHTCWVHAERLVPGRQLRPDAQSAMGGSCPLVNTTRLAPEESDEGATQGLL